MAGISGAGSKLDIKLGQSPITKDPQLNPEFQQIYNALHTLNQYMDALRAEYEGNDTNNPAENVRFVKRFWTNSYNGNAAGDIVCPGPGATVMRGVSTTEPPGQAIKSHPANQAQGLRNCWALKRRIAWVALTAAGPGERVQVGVSPGIIAVAGAQCGQIVWGRQAIGIVSRNGQTNGTSGPEQITDRPFINDGAIYLGNPQGYNRVGSLYFAYEGIMLPGYPYRSGDYYYIGRAFLFPIGIAVADGFVLITDYCKDPLDYLVFETLG